VSSHVQGQARANDERSVRRLTAAAVAMGILLVGTIGAFFAFKAAAGGHGSFLTAKVFFPFARLSGLLAGTISAGGLTLAAIQFPLYAGAAAAAVLRGRGSRAAAAILALHGIAVAACLVVLRGDTFTP